MILVAGDSFVYGSELADCRPDIVSELHTGYSRTTFAALLAKKFECVAWPGYGNDSIARTTISKCEQGNITGVLVSWTFPGRYEFRFNYHTKQRTGPWYTINPWTIQTDYKSIEQEFAENNKTVLLNQIDTIERAKKTGVVEFADAFYRHVGSSEYWEVYSSLKEIVYLQNYLKVKNIPYLFTCADNSILYNYTIGNADSTIKGLVEQIHNDYVNWFWFPAGTNPQDTQNPRGFYQWAVENKYKVGTTHPLEDAHQAAAELMKDQFNEMVKKSN